MQFLIKREKILKPLQIVSGVIERKQSIPILSNILLKVNNNFLYLVGTDTEIESTGKIELENPLMPGDTTVSAKKLIDICKNLEERSTLDCYSSESTFVLKSGRSIFHLSTLPSGDFPESFPFSNSFEFSISKKKLRFLIESTCFSMAHQDVRYYLNGMLWDVSDKFLNVIATDGHRLALSHTELAFEGQFQVILPRKAVFELLRLLVEGEEEVNISLSSSQIRVQSCYYTFTSKLIDGTFPDYIHLIPKNHDILLHLDKDSFKQALNRVAVLSNERDRSVCLELRRNLIRIISNNPEQGKAEECLDVHFDKEDFDIAFNVDYLLEALSGLSSGIVTLGFGDSERGVLLKNDQDDTNIYVVMPVRPALI